MKIQRLSLLVILFALASVLLSACGGTLYHTWPGITAGQDVFYVANQNALFALNANTGAEVWRYPQKAESGKSFYAAPAIADSLIIVGDYAHNLYAIDMNGMPKWPKPFNTPNGNFVASPLVMNDTILAPASDNRLYALDMNGSQRWVFEAKNMLWATPASDGSLVFQPGLDHLLYALNFSNGKKVWEKDLGSALQSAPLLTEAGTLYISSLAGDVIALNAQDGAILWKVSTGAKLWSTPLLNEDTLYIGDESGKITALSAKDGSLVWEKNVGSPIVGGGVLVTDGVAFATEGGSLVAQSFDGQKQLWNQSINGKLYTTPAVVGQNLAVAITEGDKVLLQAYNVNGQPSWKFDLPK